MISAFGFMYGFKLTGLMGLECAGLMKSGEFCEAFQNAWRSVNGL